MKRTERQGWLCALCAIDLSIGQAIGTLWTYDEWFHSWCALPIIAVSAFVNIALVHKLTQGN